MTRNYFELFELEAKFNIELTTLERNFRKMQSESHPDRFVTASSAEKLQSMQIATLANEAYLTLKSPAMRAAYLLGLQGIVAISETNTTMPVTFLMQQMEWREQLEDAKQARDIAAIEALERELKTEAKHLQAEFRTQFDEKKDYETATDIAKKLIFIDKVSADITHTIDALDA